MLLLIPVKFGKWRDAGNNVIPGTASITQKTKLVIILFGNISPDLRKFRDFRNSDNSVYGLFTPL